MKDDSLYEDIDRVHDDDLKKIESLSNSPKQESSQRPLSSQQIPVLDNIRKAHKKNVYIEGYSNETWRKSALIIVYIISKFVQSLQQQSNTIKFRTLSRKVFELLNDRSSDYDFYLITKRIKGQTCTISFLTRRLLGFCVKHIPTKLQNFNAIEPDGYFKIIWDTFMMFITILNIFYIPMKLAFDLQQNQTDLEYYLLDQIPSWVFIADIALNFNTAYYNEGKINSNRKSIIMHYLKGDFLLDAVVIAVFFISKYEIPYIDFILLLRITRVNKMFENVEEALSLREKFAAVIDLLRLIYLVVFVGHFCACAWYYLAHYETGNSWLIVQHITDASTSTKYIKSLYWSVITLLTVGYGDITPVTDTEMIFVIIMALITCGVFGYAINSIGSIFKEINQKNDKLRDQMATINSHMRRHNINKQLQLKVRKYFEYYFQRHDEQDEKVSQLMSDLAPDLKNDILIEMYKKTLLQSKLLRENLSDQCLNKLCLCVKEQRLSPDELVFEKGKQSDRLYFVVEGRLKICFEKKNPNKAMDIQSTKIRYYKEGYVLGEKNFLLQNEMNYQAQAAGFSRIAYISYEDFISCAQMFPLVYEKVCLLKDKLHYNQHFKKVFTVCEVCGSNHAFNKCPFPFFLCNRSKILYMENKSKHHERQPFTRLKERPFMKIPRSIVQQAGLAICLNENIMNEDDLNDEYLNQLGFADNQNENSQLSLFKEDSFDKEMNKASLLLPKKKSNPHPEEMEVLSVDRILRFDEFPFDRERNQSQSGNLTPRASNQKGILKKSTFVPLNFSVEGISGDLYQKSISDCSESSVNKRAAANHQKINRSRNRHQKLSIKYDRANQFLNQLVKYNSMMSQKSVTDADAATMKSSQNRVKLKQLALERQSTTQTAVQFVDTHVETSRSQQLYTHQIKDEAIYNFEKQKSYETYFPEFNIEAIIDSMNQVRKNYQHNSIHSSNGKRLNEKGGNLVKKKLVSSYFHQKRLNNSKKSQIQISEYK